MPTPFKKIADERDLRGKRVLLRLDLNVPIVEDEVRDDFRIRRSLPTIALLQEKKAKIIIVSHIESELTDSLSRVASYIGRYAPIKAFVTRLEDAAAVIATMQEGEIVMLENLRKNPGEKANDPVFAGRLAHLADYFVNDAFAVCHREHASVVSVPRLMPSFAGPLLSEEVEELSKTFDPPHPFLFVLGGAKFDTKLPLIEKFLDIADTVFVGGALANDVYKEKGLEIGTSLAARAPINLKHIEANPKLVVPSDVVVSSPREKATKKPDQVGIDEKIMDAGPQSVSELSDILSEAQMVLSALVRTGERFGAAHVVDVIVGADTQKVRELRHDQIKTYGAGKHKDKPFWRSLIGEMLGRGLLALDPGPYPVLKLTGACLPVLQGKETFEILELGSREKAAKKKAAAASGAAGDEGEVADVDHDLFDRLRALRKRLAGNQGIPPYMVFSDRTLHEMCRQMPMSVADFREIPGVGDNKRDKYGIEFVQEIRAYAGKT